MQKTGKYLFSEQRLVFEFRENAGNVFKDNQEKQCPKENIIKGTEEKLRKMKAVLPEMKNLKAEKMKSENVAQNSNKINKEETQMPSNQQTREEIKEKEDKRRENAEKGIKVIENFFSEEKAKEREAREKIKIEDGWGEINNMAQWNEFLSILQKKGRAILALGSPRGKEVFKPIIDMKFKYAENKTEIDQIKEKYFIGKDESLKEIKKQISNKTGNRDREQLPEETLYSVNFPVDKINDVEVFVLQAKDNKKLEAKEVRCKAEPKNFTLANFEKEVIQASKEKPVLVVFSNDNCYGCWEISPLLIEMANLFGEKVIIGKFNGKFSSGMSLDIIKEKYGYKFNKAPTLYFFKDGKVVDNDVGSGTKTWREGIIQAINKWSKKKN